MFGGCGRTPPVVQFKADRCAAGLNSGVWPLVGIPSFIERIQMILGLRTTIYPTPDLAAAKLWYAQVLGQQPYFDEPFYVGFNVGGFELGLIPDGEPGVAGPQALWGVADASQEHARLIELGATSLDPVTDVGGGIKVGAVADPFGNRFGIIENPHFDAASVR
jgi:catechol 2,3-dioxygenase-like lactoylglutathione lyase family enzyme